MDKKELMEFIELAYLQINKGDWTKALEMTERIKTLGPNYLISYYLSGLLIDIGSCLEKETIVEEGRIALERDFEEIIRHKELAVSATYNLGNAYQAKASFQFEKEQNIFFQGKDNLDFAKDHYRKALQLYPDNKLKTQILVNLGNCFDKLGRVVEALDCFDLALTLDPNFGMALGNKGKALRYYSMLCGEHQGTYILEAYALLKSSKARVTSEAALDFANYIRIIEEHNKELPLQNPPQYPGLSIKGRSNFEQYQIDYCLQNALYLNVCSICRKCDAAIGDTIRIKSMTVAAKDISYLKLSSYLNEIKQDYVTARALIILSTYDKINLDFLDKYVTIVNTLDDSQINIYIQLIKTSFKTFYDILDKIAFFINDFLHLGLKDTEINFSTIWYTSNKREEVKEGIVKTKSASLNALFDLHKDLDYGAFHSLKDMRNSLTHRFVKIKIKPKIETDREMKEETLINQTLVLAKLVRSAIIYLLQLVQVEEFKKLMKTNKSSIPIPIPIIPFKQKKRRSRQKSKTIRVSTSEKQ